MITAFIVTAVFAAPLLAAAYTDFWSMKIPNKVSVAMFAGFFLTLPLTWQGVPALAEHLGMFLVFFLAGFSLFAFGLVGGGDAKLMAAIALWFGWGDALNFIAYTTLFGAALGLFLMLSGSFAPIRLRTSVLGMRLFQGGKDMPYGIALATGALFVWPTSLIGAALIGG
ncbi:MAG: prepilin peptidase [Pseudomonadota bacterium]